MIVSISLFQLLARLYDEIDSRNSYSFMAQSWVHSECGDGVAAMRHWRLSASGG